MNYFKQYEDTMSDKKGFKHFIKSINWLRFSLFFLLSVVAALSISLWVYPKYRDGQLLDQFASPDYQTRMEAIRKMMYYAKKHPESLERVKALLDSEKDEEFQSAYFLLRDLKAIDQKTLNPLYRDRANYVELLYYKQSEEPHYAANAKKYSQARRDNISRNWIGIVHQLLMSNNKNKYVEKSLTIAANSPYRFMRASASTLAAKLGKKEILVKLAQDSDILVKLNSLIDILLTDLARDQRIRKVCREVLAKYTPLANKDYPNYQKAMRAYRKLNQSIANTKTEYDELKAERLRNPNVEKSVALKRNSKIEDLEAKLRIYKKTYSYNIRSIFRKTKNYTIYRKLLACAFGCLSKSQRLKLSDFPTDPKNPDPTMIAMIASCCDFKLLNAFEDQAELQKTSSYNSIPIIRIARAHQKGLAAKINPLISSVNTNLSNPNILVDSELGLSIRQNLLAAFMLTRKQNAQFIELEKLHKFIESNYCPGYPQLFSEAIFAYSKLLKREKKNSPAYKKGVELLKLITAQTFQDSQNTNTIVPIPAATAAVELWKLKPAYKVRKITPKNIFTYKPNSLGIIKSVITEKSGLARDTACWQLANSKVGNIDKLISRLKKSSSRALKELGMQLQTYHEKLNKKPATNIKELEIAYKQSLTNDGRAFFACLLEIANRSYTRTMIGMLKAPEFYCPSTPASSLLLSGSPDFFTRFLWNAYSPINVTTDIIVSMNLQPVIQKVYPKLLAPVAELDLHTQIFQVNLMRRAFLISSNSTKQPTN